MCDALASARSGDVEEARAAFFGGAHDGLHDLAARTADIDRAVTADLLRAKGTHRGTHGLELSVRSSVGPRRPRGRNRRPPPEPSTREQYCVSRFCGPITDTVQELAQEYGDRMDFVHLEVLKDFEANTLNKAAVEWIWPDRQGHPAEP